MSRTDNLQQERTGPVDTASGPDDEPDEDEWVELPADTNGGRRILTIGVGVILVMAFAVGALLFWVSRRIDPRVNRESSWGASRSPAARSQRESPGSSQMLM
ncbi:MAG: hypothetical protein M5U19_04480 [Microthrixaceae bacterium]|nr:hypothetical protein [Microthrixaceae bacterium]